MNSTGVYFIYKKTRIQTILTQLKDVNIQFGVHIVQNCEPLHTLTQKEMNKKKELEENKVAETHTYIYNFFLHSTLYTPSLAAAAVAVA